MNVELIDYMGSDLTVVNAARVSFSNSKTDLEFPKDEKLIKYLAKHNHWTPFGHVQVQFRIKAPIFVARQLGKHQVGMVWNETSRRYVDKEPEFYKPPNDQWRTKAENVKQGSDPNQLVNYDIQSTYDALGIVYKHMLLSGVAPEMARMILPQSMMTEWIWTGSLAAFARVCKLRCADDTQQETRVIANLIADEMLQLFPASWNALIN
jgi:thymidylate synthase (FAD)